MQAKACWTEGLPLPETLHILKSLARKHFQKGGVLGRQCCALMEHDHWLSLLKTPLPYLDECDVMHLLEVRQGLGFFEKLEPLELGLDKEAVAKEKFFETERDCRETNDLLRQAASGVSVSLMPDVWRLIESSRRKIRFVLGVCPKADNLRFHFGPGATTDLTKRSASPTEKLASGFQCSANMLASGLLPTYLRASPHWLNCFEGSAYCTLDGFEASLVDVKIVPGKLVCVPKSAKTYRTIMVEPVLNGFVQQGIRHAMERRLALSGLSTRDQSINADLARRGSITGELATIDLSSASDLISYELIKLLLPPDWFRLLSSARTGNVEVDGGVLPLEKFSSMGNAYTFPLETLVFWAIVKSALDLQNIEGCVSVYGDDIIVPTCGYKHVARALTSLGFKLNHSKSFHTGRFRESCGHDYYSGIDIRPYYQKQLVSGQTLFSLHNFYVRHLNYEMAAEVLEFIPADQRIYGPEGYGDGHLLSESWPRQKTKKMLAKGYSGASFETYQLQSIRKTSRYPGDYVSPLYSVYISGRSALHDLVPVEESPTAVRVAADGRPKWVYPGFNGYKRVKIYTLAS